MPLIVSTPVELSKAPLIPFWVVNSNTSPVVKSLLIVTLALESSMSSGSLIAMVLSIIAARLFSVYAKEPPAVTTGTSLRGVIVIILVTPELFAAPAPSELASVTTQVMVRLPDVTVGSSLDELKVMDLDAVW